MSDKTTTIFDFLNDVSHLKNNILNDETVKEYNPFFMNRWISMRPDTIMYAQEMNLNSHLPKDMQYDYYFHSLKKQKRYFKYVKHKRQDDIEIIMKYHNMSERRAKEILSLFSNDDIEYMKSKMFTGGTNGK